MAQYNKIMPECWNLKPCSLTNYSRCKYAPILQRYQSKILRLITQAPWYVTNQILHRDLGIAPLEKYPKTGLKVIAKHSRLTQTHSWDR
jgi:hypothetical protein